MLEEQSVNAKAKFDVAIQALVNNKNASIEENIQYAKLKNFIRNTLQQFNLRNVEVDEVIHETYIRGVKLTEDGEEIKIPWAWIKATSYNIIREISRKQTKHQPVDSNFIEYQMDLQELKYNLTTEDEDNAEIKLLFLALKKLELKDRQVLVLAYIYNLPWKEVVNHLASFGEVVSIATARQRGSRSLERLRKVYKSMKSES